MDLKEIKKRYKKERKKIRNIERAKQRERELRESYKKKDLRLRERKSNKNKPLNVFFFCHQYGLVLQVKKQF